MAAEKITSLVDSIPNSGEWWTQYGRGVFIESAEKLIALGLSEEQTALFLHKLYQAVSAEYGN